MERQRKKKGDREEERRGRDGKVGQRGERKRI